MTAQDSTTQSMLVVNSGVFFCSQKIVCQTAGILNDWRNDTAGFPDLIHIS